MVKYYPFCRCPKKLKSMCKALFNCISNCFKKKEPYVDPDRVFYRNFFNIIDDYLIEYCIEQEEGEEKETGYIVYIDPENDIDWKDTRTKKDWTPDEKKKWAQSIAKLNDAHAEPTGHLSFETIRAFKLKIGAGYVLAMNRSFDEIDKVITEALRFLRHRNAEKSRQLFLTYSTICVLIILGLWIWNTEVKVVYEDWALSLFFGTLGSYFSIWTRYGKLVMTGLSTKILHFLETLTRLIIGAISASVLILAVRCGIILPKMAETAPLWFFGLVGFAAGFSERMIPSLMEKLSKQMNQNE